MELLIKFFAEYLGYILIVGFLVFFWKNKKKYPKLIFEAILAAVLSRGIITEAIRFFWQRSRPFVEQNIAPLMEHSSSASFPSGHASFYFAVGTVLYFYNKKAGILFLLGSAVIGITRVAAGLHWQSDVIAGALVGIASGFLVVQLSRRFFK